MTIEKHECDSCGKKTSDKGMWGVYHCLNCSKKYRSSVIRAIQDLISKHTNEYNKLLDKRIDMEFKK